MIGEDCPFCRIVRAESQCALVFEDELSLAFLDHSPVFPGHTLLVPREHYRTLTDLPGKLLSPFFGNAQRIAWAVQQGLQADGTLVLVNNTVSQSVAHLHIHIIPRHWHDGLRGFLWPRQRYESPEEMEKTCAAIRAAIQNRKSEIQNE